MKKKLLLLFFILLGFNNLNSQIFGDKTLVTTANDDIDSFIFNDIDSDGDIDIIASSKTIDQVFWYKNLGSETFSTKIVLSSNYVNPSNVKLLDVDVDGKKDILVGETASGAGLSWIKNMGSGFFGNKQSFPSCGFCALTTIDVGDIDNDGDDDVIISELSNDTLRLTKNMGSGVFEVQSGLLYVTSEGRNLRSFEFANLDGDTQNELILSTGGSTTQKIIQIEYNGTAFVETLLYSSAIANPFIYESYLKDMDNDGQVDIISKIQDCGIVWFKNFGSNVFSSPNSIGLPCASGALSTIGDLNLDNNADLIHSGLKWRENMGSGSFNSTFTQISATTIATTNSQLFDIDADGDLDLFFVSTTEFGWFKNNSIELSTIEINENTFTVYPNPSSSELNITSKVAFNRYKVYEVNGRLIQDVSLPNLDTECKIDLSTISTGVYLLEIQSDTTKQQQKFIKN
ncbi:MAG TPA: T9SS type A sorting domain-containing protein [Flavobacterium lutivivi]|nr:T9SS type A sorting domain-containing protein [Flavobacterium lutivivi]